MMQHLRISAKRRSSCCQGLLSRFHAHAATREVTNDVMFLRDLLQREPH